MSKYTAEQLQHYLVHPEEVDASDEDLLEALQRLEAGGSPDTGAEETTKGGDKKPEGESDDDDAQKVVDDATAQAAAEAKAKDQADAAAAAKAAGKTGEPGKTEGAVQEKGGERVLTADGMNTLPYKVLKDEREGRRAAEDALGEAQRTILSLSERVKAIQKGETDPGNTGDEKSPEELEAILAEIEEEAPHMKGPLEKLIKAVRMSQEQVEMLVAERDDDQDKARARLETQAQAALDANPTLILWKSDAEELFEEAISFDKMLREDERQRARYPTYTARFDRVVELVKANHAGEDLPLPQPVAASAAKAAPASAAAKPSPKQITEAAKKALAEAGDTSVVTLSDIPGGMGEVTTEEALERMDVTQVADKFGKMTPQQIIDWVSSH